MLFLVNDTDYFVYGEDDVAGKTVLPSALVFMTKTSLPAPSDV